MLSISYDQDNAILYNSQDMVRLANDTFQKKYSFAAPIYHAFRPDPEQYLESTLESTQNLNAESYHELLYQPCLPCFCPEDILLDRLNKELIPPPLQQFIAAYFAKLRSRYNKATTCFTLEGLNLFMETGKVTEIPDFMYNYLTPRQRLVLLKNIISSVDDGSFRPRVIRSDKFSVPSPICITSTGEQQVTIYYFSPDSGQYIFQLNELSLVQSFHDFLTFLPQSDLVYSEEESAALLHKAYERYSKIYA